MFNLDDDDGLYVIDEFYTIIAHRIGYLCQIINDKTVKIYKVWRNGNFDIHGFVDSNIMCSYTIEQDQLVIVDMYNHIFRMDMVKAIPHSDGSIDERIEKAIKYACQ